MLTKSDAKVIESLLDRKLDEKLDLKLKPIHDDIKIIKKDVKKLRKDVDGVIRMADRGLLSTQRRVQVIEKHLHFPEVDFA